ncbi:MAG: PEP-CTERM sorting domain-containing protein [Roseateles sp.]
MYVRVLALLGLAVAALSAQAQSQYRVFAEAYGGYYNHVSTTSPLFGLDPNGNPNVVYGTVYYGWDYRNGSAFHPTEPTPSVSIGGTWDGDASVGMTPVTVAGYAATGWGTNHASASLSGFTPINLSYDGTFNYPGGSAPQYIETNNSAYAVGRSTWEELYQIGGGTGTGQFTASIHIDGTLGGTGSVGSASLNWHLTTFSGDTVASVTAWYDSAADYWYKNVYSNGTWSFSDGTGALAIDENVVGSYSFTYGSALYLKSELYTSVSGNGTVDFSNTVQFTGMQLPQGALVYVLSGASANDYGISFAGNGSGTICETLSCTLGGGGVSPPPVPEPGTYAMLLAGLGAIAWVARRPKRAARPTR